MKLTLLQIPIGLLKKYKMPWRTVQVIKKVVVTLLVEVDTEDEHICPSGDPLIENCVLNVVDDRFFEDPVTVLGVSYLQTLL